jgi:hypothetical protein
MSYQDLEKRGKFTLTLTHHRLSIQVSSATMSDRVKPQQHTILTDKDCRNPESNNVGARVTRSQQVKILLSNSLAAFTVVGKSFQSEAIRHV